MTMSVTQSVLTIGVVVLGTMMTRFLPFLIFPEGKEAPPFIRYLGTVLPSAVIGLLVVYALKSAPTSSWRGLPELIAVAAVGIVHKWKHNMFLSMAVGTVLYMLLVQNVFVG